MKKICGWCHREMDDKPYKDGDKISHGICNACLPVVKREWEREADLIGRNNRGLVLEGALSR